MVNHNFNPGGFREEELEGDNLGVINVLSNKETDLVSGGVIVSDILELYFSYFASFFSFVKRLDNSVVHSLAQFTVSISDVLV